MLQNYITNNNNSRQTSETDRGEEIDGKSRLLGMITRQNAFKVGL